MAWRIAEAVVRGEIDNRTHGHLAGYIWFAGRAEPVRLELEGNCWRDLAGRRLEFTNPEPKTVDIGILAAIQQGVVGDITASRKVKVPEIPLDQIGEYYAAKKPWPWHWGNSLYLEWFSRSNGRVVIESATFELRIAGDSAWEMTPEEETEQRRANTAAMTGFMDRLVEAAGAQANGAREDAPPEWDEKPQTEEAAEAMQARSDLLADRVEARLRREGENADYEKILHEEIERLRQERGEPELTPGQLARNAEWLEEMNRAAEEELDNPDPEIENEIKRKHPLAERAFELSLRLRHAAQAERWAPEGASPEHPVVELEGAVMCAGAKLAGALNGCEWPPLLDASAGVIVRLKRARGYLDDALRAAEACREDKLIAPARLNAVVAEVAGLAKETDELIAELRAKLERGMD